MRVIHAALALLVVSGFSSTGFAHEVNEYDPEADYAVRSNHHDMCGAARADFASAYENYHKKNKSSETSDGIDLVVKYATIKVAACSGPR